MRKIKRKNLILLTLLAAVFIFILFPYRSDATTVTLNSLGWGQSISYTYKNLMGSWAGEFHISIDGAGDYIAFCVDLDDYIYVGGTYRADILEVTGNYLGAAWLVNTFGSSIGSNIEGAALQAAIWETIYGSQFTLNSNNTPLIDLFNGYLNGLPNNLSGLENYSLLNLQDSQMLVSRVAVPEPSTLLLLGASLLGLGILGRKKFRTKP